jgi:hypothetical protein
MGDPGRNGRPIADSSGSAYRSAHAANMGVPTALQETLIQRRIRHYLTIDIKMLEIRTSQLLSFKLTVFLKKIVIIKKISPCRWVSIQMGLVIQ